MPNDYVFYGYAFVVTVLLSMALTWIVRRAALRWGVLDHPGERKMQREPVPLLGGVAIVASFYLVVVAHVAVLAVMRQFGLDWLEARLMAFLGEHALIKLLGVLGGGTVIFLVGLIDDLYALRPWVKLAGQIAAASLLVFSGMRIEAFLLTNFWVSAAATIFWVVLLINAMNFLDNMDGLCGGVSVIAALSYFLCVQSYEEEGHQMVRLLLIIFAGAMAGFLYHNLNPAKIYMGDAGSMFSGFFLATVAVMGTFHVEGGGGSRMAVAAPVLALSVPLFDLLSVVYIRWRAGQSIMLGDKRHFSHRLVDLGMTPRQAVEFILLVAAVVGLGGALLPLLPWQATLIIIAQTVGIFMLIVLLMNAGRWTGKELE